MKENNPNNASDARFCGAKTRKGTPCRKWGMENGRCRLHGGATPKGIASANFKTGRHSKYLRGNLAELYASALTDDAPLRLEDEIALIDARINDVLGNVHADLWTSLHDNWDALLLAIEKGDRDGQGRQINALNRVIQSGADDASKWGEVYDLVERRRRLVDTNQRMLERAQQTVSVERAMLYVTAIVDAFKRSIQKNAEKSIARQIILDADTTYAAIVGPER